MSSVNEKYDPSIFNEGIFIGPKVFSENFGNTINFNGTDYTYGGDAKGTGKKEVDRDEVIYTFAKYSLFAMVPTLIILASLAAGLDGAVKTDLTIASVAFGIGTAGAIYAVVKKYKKVPYRIMTGKVRLDRVQKDMPLLIKGARLTQASLQTLITKIGSIADEEVRLKKVIEVNQGLKNRAIKELEGSLCQDRLGTESAKRLANSTCRDAERALSALAFDDNFIDRLRINERENIFTFHVPETGSGRLIESES